MIIVRETFKAKYGHGDELVALLKQGAELLAGRSASPARILTDLSGQFFTVQLETEMESLAAFEESMELFADPAFGPWFEQMMALVESGSREFYNIEE